MYKFQISIDKKIIIKVYDDEVIALLVDQIILTLLTLASCSHTNKKYNWLNNFRCHGAP